MCMSYTYVWCVCVYKKRCMLFDWMPVENLWIPNLLLLLSIQVYFQLAFKKFLAMLRLLIACSPVLFSNRAIVSNCVLWCHSLVLLTLVAFSKFSLQRQTGAQSAFPSAGPQIIVYCVIWGWNVNGEMVDEMKGMLKLEGQLAWQIVKKSWPCS